MRQSQKGRRALMQLPTLVLDISRGRRTSLVAPFPLRRCVFSFPPEGFGHVIVHVTDSRHLVVSPREPHRWND